MKFSSIIVFVNFSFVFTQVFCEPHHYRTSYQYCAPTQTFFNGHCRLIGSTEHCPVNMQLFDGPNQQGFCHCDDYSYQEYHSDGTASCFGLDNEDSNGAPPVLSTGQGSIPVQTPCRPGTVRDRFGRCISPNFIG